MAFGEDVDVLPVRVGEIDREAGADRADDQRRVRACGRLSPEGQGQEAQEQHPAHAPRVGAGDVQSTDSLKRESQRRRLTRRSAARRLVDGDSLRAPRAARGRRGLRLLAPAGDVSEPRPRGAEAPRAPARLGAFDARAAAVVRREIATLSFLYRHSCPTSCSPPPTRVTTASRWSCAAFAAFAPRSSSSTCSDGSTTTAAAFGRPGAGFSLRPKCARRAQARGHARRTAPRAATLCSTTRIVLSNGSFPCSRRTGREAFGAEWERIEPKLAESVEEWASRSPRDGMHAFLLTLVPQLRVDSGGRSFGLDVRTAIAYRSGPRIHCCYSERLHLASRPDQLRAPWPCLSSTARLSSSRGCVRRHRPSWSSC